MRITREDATNTVQVLNRVLAPGGVGNAVSLDGTNDFVALPDNVHDTENAGSFSAWVKFDDLTGTNGVYSAIFTVGSADNFLLTCFVGNDNYPTAALRRRIGIGTTRTSSYYYVYGTSTSFTEGQWYHITATSNGSTWKLYVDGAEESLTVFLGGNIGHWFNDVATGTTKYRIGYSPGGTQPLDGTVDEIAIWDRAISSAEVTTLYNGGDGYYIVDTEAPGNSGLLNLYHADEGTGTTLTDETGSNNGTLTNGATWAAGIVPLSASMKEVCVLESKDGAGSGEEGITTVGDSLGRLVLNGATTRFQYSGVEQFSIDSTGSLVFPDDYKVYFDDAKALALSTDGTDWTMEGGNLSLDQDGSGNGSINGIYLGDYVSSGKFISTEANKDTYKGIRFETGMTVGDGSSIAFLVVSGVMEMKRYDIDCSVDFRITVDNEYITWGAGDDSGITYNGTNMLLNPKLVGSGYLNIQGQTLVDDKIMFTQTDGNEYIDSLADGYMDYGATTQHRFNNHIVPATDDSYYLGEIGTPFKAYKGVILKDTTDGKHYKIEVISGTVTATALD